MSDLEAKVKELTERVEALERVISEGSEIARAINRQTRQMAENAHNARATAQYAAERIGVSRGLFG